MRTDGSMIAGSSVLISASGSFGLSDAGKYIQVIGAGPGGTAHSDGTISAGSKVLSSGSGTFASTDVGRGIVVVGAGPGGSNLVTAIQQYSSSGSVTLTLAAGSNVSNTPYFYGAMTLEARILSVQSSTSVSLSSPAAATITGATFAYGTDNHAAFQAALDSVGIAGGGTVHVPQPGSCPSGAVCGYVTTTTDQMTAKAPGAVKIRYNNISLVGDAPQTNLFCRGAWSTYTNSVAFPGQTATIRGTCVALGDNGGPNGSAGIAVSNITVANLHLFGMTNGNTYSVNFTPTTPPMTTTGDGWDETHKAIYMWDNSSFSNITINSVFIQDFKGENIYSGGSTLTGILIENSTLTNFNGDGISMLAADLRVLNNHISNGSNSGVENSTRSVTSTALVRQIYDSNTVSFMQREGINVVGVDSGVAAGVIQITNNYFDTIGQIHGNGARSAVYVNPQAAGNLPPANVTVSGNTCHDCYSFGSMNTSGNTQVTANTFIVDTYAGSSFMSFMNPLNGILISNNTGYMTSNAVNNSVKLGSVYMIDPGYQTGSFVWTNATLQGNVWNFPGTPNYTFVTSSGLGFNIIGHYNLIWQGDTCQGCTYPDRDHGLVSLGSGTTIEPYGPVVYVNGNSGPVTATVDKSKEQDGSVVQIVNAGSNQVTFASDSNLSLASTVTLPGGTQSSVKFVYSSALGKFTLQSGTAGGAANIVSTRGTPQSAMVGTGFATSLQATVTDGSGRPVSGVSVTFSAPVSGAAALFGGSNNSTNTTDTNGLATAPAMSANSQAGSYSVTATVSGVSASANFSLNNTAGAAARITATSGASQSTSVTRTFSSALQATVADANGNPVSGVTVTFAAPVAGASATFAGATSVNVVTQSNGIAISPALTANGQVGSYAVTASVSGIGAGASFSLTNNASTPASIAATGGASQSVTVNKPFGVLLQATVKDASGNPLSGVTVTFSAPAGGPGGTFGGLASASAVTNASGVATAPALTANGQAGSYTVTASTAGVGTQAVFNLTNTASVPVSSGGALSGSGNSLTTPVNLTAEGGADWVHWGESSLTRKAGVNAQLSDYTVVGAGMVQRYTNDPRLMSWSDGSPVGSGVNNADGIYISFIGQGFAFQAPADTTLRTLAVHVGGWNSGGTFTAHLSDGSAVDFTDVTSPASGQYDRNYTLSYHAGSSGQALTMSWTMTSGTGNVTVNGAALAGQVTAPANVTTPATITASAGASQSVTVNKPFGVLLQATVKDGSGNLLSGVTVTFSAPASGPGGTFNGAARASAVTNASGVATAAALTANGQAGSYTVTASTAGLGTQAVFNLTNTASVPVSSGGALSGSGNSLTTPVNLTAEGGADWVHWGESSLTRKAGVNAQLSDYTVVGAGLVQRYSNDIRLMNWSDGSPVGSGVNNADGIYISFLGQGFAFQAPADTTLRTLAVHVGGWNSGGTFTAHLSDGSAVDFTDVTSPASAQYDRNYTLSYRAGSSGQALTVSWTMTSGANVGNVTLNAASLQ